MSGDRREEEAKRIRDEVLKGLRMKYRGWNFTLDVMTFKGGFLVFLKVVEGSMNLISKDWDLSTYTYLEGQDNRSLSPEAISFFEYASKLIDQQTREHVEKYFDVYRRDSYKSARSSKRDRYKSSRRIKTLEGSIAEVIMRGIN